MKTFVKIVNLIGNLIVLNFLFVVMSALSAGIFLGTCLTALYATFLDLKTDDSGYYIRNYFKHFKANIKYTLIIDIVLILLGGAAYLNILMINTIDNSSTRLILYAVLALVCLEIAIISSFLFPVCAKFTGDLLHLLYLAFLFGHKYIYLSILFILMFAGSVLLCIYVSFAFIFIMFGLIVWIQSLILKRIWKGYQYEVSEL